MEKKRNDCFFLNRIALYKYVMLCYVITHLYINVKHLGHRFAFDVPTVWNDLPDDVPSVISLLVSGKS